MILNTFRYVALIMVLVLSGCSLHKNQSLQTKPDTLPDTPPPVVAEENQQPVEITPIDIAASVVSEESGTMKTGVEGVADSTSALEDSREALPIVPLPEEIPVNEAIASVERTDIFDSEENVETGQNLLDSALDFVDSSQVFWGEGDQDQAIGNLDEAYSLVIKVDTDKTPDLFQQKEDLRYMISKRILEVYASRYTATNGKHNEIPLTLNEYVEKEIKRFQGSARQSFIIYYQRSGRFMPMIRQALKEAGLPEDLAWLPLIESGFTVDAQSKARALGMWQFIASTGQKFGLKRDTWVDERLDPEKATAAAIAYLQELHHIFGDWTTVLAGYNCGEGRVLRTIRNQKINYLDNFWDLFQQLPYETARYVPRFLATLHILKDPGKYGFEFEEPDLPVAYDTVTINKPAQLSAVAAAMAVPEKELLALNPELRHKATPPTTYLLKVPEGKAGVLLASINDLPNWSPPTSSYHRVQKGESLSVIAQKYRTSVARIVLANNIQKQNLIRVGQRLKVPLSGAAVGSTNTVSTPELKPGSKYQVKKGDSLWLIARKFNTNTERIQQINKLKDTLLSVGQILTIPQ